MAKKVKVSELVQQFQLEVVSGSQGLKRVITVDDLNRPGLEMAGYFEYHPQERVQLLGRTELAFLQCYLKQSVVTGCSVYARRKHRVSW